MRARFAFVVLIALTTLACADPAQEHIDRSRELAAAGDVEGAMAALEEATVANPSNPSAWNNLATLTMQSGRPERAMELYRRAIAADSERLEPHYNLANLLNDAGRSEEAIEEYRRAAAIDDSRGEVHYNLAFTLYSLDRFDQAWIALEHARASGADAEAVIRLEAAIRHYYTPDAAAEPAPQPSPQ